MRRTQGKIVFGLRLALCAGMSLSSAHAQIVGGGLHPRQPLPPGYQNRAPFPLQRNAQPSAPAQTATPAPTPAIADTPLTLTQQPTTPPQVTFRNGELSISAQNSTLADVLRAVRTQTGATVEIPSNATERVVANIGPGPAQEVLASLLNGSRYNYVLAGSASNPNELDHVILMPKTGSDAQVAQATPGAPPPTANNGEEAQGLDMQEAETPADDAMSPEAQGQQEAQDQNNNNPNADQPGLFGTGQPPGVRSPQQLLQDLQQRQQQNGNQGFFPGAPVQQPQPEQ